MNYIHYYDYVDVSKIYSNVDVSLVGAPIQRPEDGAYFVPFSTPMAFCLPSGCDTRIDLCKKRSGSVSTFELKLTSTLVESDHFLLLYFFRALDTLCSDLVVKNWFDWKGVKYERSLEHSILRAYSPVAGECITDTVGSSKSMHLPGIPKVAAAQATSQMTYSILFHASAPDVIELQKMSSDATFHDRYYIQLRITGIEISKKNYRLRIELNSLIPSSDLFLDTTSTIDEDVVSHYESLSMIQVPIAPQEQEKEQEQEQEQEQDMKTEEEKEQEQEQEQEQDMKTEDKKEQEQEQEQEMKPEKEKEIGMEMEIKVEEKKEEESSKSVSPSMPVDFASLQAMFRAQFQLFESEMFNKFSQIGKSLFPSSTQ